MLPINMFKGNRPLLFPVMLIGYACLVSGCGSTTDDLDKFITDTNQSARASLQPIPGYKPVENVEYSGELVGRDPFTRYDTISRQAQRSQRLKQNRALGPLEKFDLDSFTYLGYIDEIDTGKRKIILLTGNGNLHNAYLNDRIGLNNGIITGISDAFLRISERVETSDGSIVVEKKVFSK